MLIKTPQYIFIAIIFITALYLSEAITKKKKSGNSLGENWRFLKFIYTYWGGYVIFSRYNYAIKKEKYFSHKTNFYL